MAKRGRFITFEGGEGCGKSTQVKLLSQALNERGIDHLVTREPGGTPLAERIRPLLVEPSEEEWTPLAETLLFLAARVQHVEKVIKPALDSGKWVICDRFMDSTFVYQGIAKGLGLARVQALQQAVLGDFMPDKTLLLDIAPEVGLKRAAARRDGETRFEDLEFSFHQKLRDGFLALAAQHPTRIAVIDAAHNVEAVHQSIIKAVQ